MTLTETGEHLRRRNAREDAVEGAWAMVDRVLKKHHRVRPYKHHTWGPKAADLLIASSGQWHNPSCSETKE